MAAVATTTVVFAESTGCLVQRLGGSLPVAVEVCGLAGRLAGD